MASLVLNTKPALLTRLRSAVSEDVHDKAPTRYTLPYVQHVRTLLAERVIINKSGARQTVDVIINAVSDPHDESIKTSAALALEVGAALEANLAITGFTVHDQYINQEEAFIDFDDQGAELDTTQITLRVETTSAS